MKIKNDYIIIKIDKKEIKLHNTILDTYISKIIENQTLISNRNELKMTHVYLKFDNELIFTESTDVKSTDFDVCFPFDDFKQNIGKNRITLNYNYTNLSARFKFYDIQNEDMLSSMAGFENRKITAIGFGTDGTFGELSLYACVDTSNYNLYTGTLKTILSITRRDIMSTDAVFYTNSSTVKGVIHLCDGQIDNGNKYVGILKSIGLGKTSNAMNQETSLIPYLEHIEIELNSIEILDELIVEYYSDGIFPADDIYPSSNIFPARIINIPLYPSKDIFPGIEQYMLEPPYQYIQLKYEIYKDTGEGLEDTSTYYLLSVPVNNKQKIKMNINYERA